MFTKFHDCRSKGSGDMLVQSLHFHTVAITPPLGHNMLCGIHSPSTIVESFIKSDWAVLAEQGFWA